MSLVKRKKGSERRRRNCSNPSCPESSGRTSKSQVPSPVPRSPRRCRSKGNPGPWNRWRPPVSMAAAVPAELSVDHAELSTEELVQRLSQVLLVEAEAINEKIEGNEFLRSSLNRLSFGSFAKLVDACASQTEDPPLLPSASPTLRRMAATMEVSRRIITATAAPARMMGFAEDYVEEQFAPWVKNRGGWVSHFSFPRSRILLAPPFKLYNKFTTSIMHNIVTNHIHSHSSIRQFHNFPPHLKRQL
uniref:Uncharacterized protein n=1 Tax=Denticeps clupeoides TaxID=299321 RepID=A0AAY4CJL3_9TELE